MAKSLRSKAIDLKARKQFPKNNFFCYRWRVVDNFNKSVERELNELHLSGGDYHKSLLNERILALYKMGYRRSKNDFMSKLTQDAMAFLEGRRTALSKAVQDESAFTKSMAMLVDSIFNVLLSCSIELNTVLGFSELFVAATEPEVQTYGSGGRTKIKSLHARFSTSMFSLVLHGYKNKIEFYVVPVEELIGKQHPGSGHEPVATCVAEMNGKEVGWLCDGQAFTEEQMESTCHMALKVLLENTQNMLSQMAVASM